MNVLVVVIIVRRKLAEVALAQATDTGAPIPSVVVDTVYDYVVFHLMSDCGTCLTESIIYFMTVEKALM